MSADDDDLTPAQEGRTPPPDTLRRRTRQIETGRGRLLRPRSWLTILLALVAIAVSLLLLMRT